MSRIYGDPIVEEKPIEGQEITRFIFNLDGNRLICKVKVSQGFVKEVGGVDQTNDVGLPLWKIYGAEETHERRIGDSTFADMVDSHWDILTTAGQPKIRRLVLFLQALGFDVVDATPIPVLPDTAVLKK